MIVQCLRDGLTVGSDLYKKGQVFRLPDDLEAAHFTGLNVAQRLEKQYQIFKGLILEQATTAEILVGLQRAEIKITDLTDGEQKQVRDLMRLLSQKRFDEAKAADDFMDFLESNHIKVDG